MKFVVLYIYLPFSKDLIIPVTILFSINLHLYLSLMLKIMFESHRKRKVKLWGFRLWSFLSW